MEEPGERSGNVREQDAGLQMQDGESLECERSPVSQSKTTF